ncbi:MULTISPECIES: sigma-70 family RNA polymerase sigma factor [Streptomyces]|uniref:sigma-70 family RNA polymerase sigma factor n=1 Tax=Streptomyces TaxID=1883 RepID=UPI0019637E44|nr:MULTISPECIES: sigma-70 family RNA polymerase sigma factor [Streptomyces]QRX90353.1 sigma-70 family RNA polymerase sigma factor [Streptomyces noursei]UJB40263.1 sigma-70 family RNA polymerase sigma factor [Streptomyces sp. A1-5]
MTPAHMAPGHPSRSTRNDENVTRWALAARSGNPEAVERFVRATHRDVWRFVAHLSSDVNSADDLTQDTYLRALTSLPRYAGRSCARVWLLSIARRVVIDRYRSAATRPRIVNSADWQAAAERAQPAGLPEFDEGVALRDLLDALDDTRREAFLLTQVLGLPYGDAAAVAGCPVGTVRSRVARARADLTGWLDAAERDTTSPTRTSWDPSGEPRYRSR